MNPAAPNQNELTKPNRQSARKRIPSILDPFTDQLLQMDDETKPLHEMVDWLKMQGIETSGANVSKFLSRRRAKRQLDREKNLVEAFQEWLAENPNATLEPVIERFKMLALSLSMQEAAAPEMLKLADKLAGTAGRAEYRTRKLVMEERRFEEWQKDDEAKALELCLKESDKYPKVSEMFTEVFIALKKAKGE